MSGTSRRAFVQRTSLTLSALALPGCAGEGTSARPPAAPDALDAPLLLAVAEVVLPTTALGAAGVERVVGEFREWAAGYDPVPELMHGYGDAEIRYGPPDPGPGWAAQLRGLDVEAQRRHRAPFRALRVDQRREIVGRYVAAERGDRLPAALEADHVALALLAYFYGTPAATDLCYGARIGKDTCRPLSAAPHRPAPVAAEG